VNATSELGAAIHEIKGKLGSIVGVGDKSYIVQYSFFNQLENIANRRISGSREECISYGLKES
jgi:hypothetical protein